MTLNAASPVRFALLGPVCTWRFEAEIDLGPPQQRAVLALLLARIGRSTSVDELIDLLWSHDPPRSAVTVVHKYLGNLRRLFEPDLPTREAGSWLVRQAGGYRIETDEDNLDLLRFRRAADDAREAAGEARYRDAVTLFDQGLRLWRDRCAMDVPLEFAARRLLTDIDGEYLAAVRDAMDNALACGMVRAVLSDLRRATEWAPLDEPLHARLMAALAAEGRWADALAVYGTIRQRLADELGINPGPELRDSHLRVLRQERFGGMSAGAEHAPPAEPAPPGPGSGQTIRPSRLPASLPSFVGRRADLARLDAVVADPNDAAGATTVVVIDGMGGVGKTTLALRWANSLADRYPDSQLHVDLRGFGPDDQMLSPEQALRELLETMGVAQQQMPGTVAAQAALYRSILAGQRVLIVLDNARNTGQIRPLIPNSPTCLVIVTSRNQLSGLTATHDAHTLSLARLPEGDAREALLRKLDMQCGGRGDPRGRDHVDDVTEITRLCAGLPLAISIVASRATTESHLTLQDIAAELRESRLDAFDQHDGAAGVRGAFSWSYRLLTEPAARLFRLLSVTGVPDVSSAAAASLAGLSQRQIRALLAELTRARLLTELGRDRYGRHDLLAAYAAELSAEHDTDEQRRAALRRFVEHYLHTAHLGHRLMGDQPTVPMPDRAADITLAELDDPAGAMAWFERERHHFPVLLRHVVEGGLAAQARCLALCVPQLQHRQRHRPDWLDPDRDPLGEAHLSCTLAGARRSPR